MSTTTLVGPRVKPRTQSYAARPAAVPSVLHIDSGHDWAGGQNQVRLLVRELECMGLRQMCICPEGSPLEERLRHEGLPVCAVPWKGPFDPRVIIAIGRQLQHFHIAHCHDAHALQTAILPARFSNVPIVASRRACFNTSAIKWNRAARVIAISEAVRDTLLKAGVRADRIRLIYSGVDMHELRSLSRTEPSLREQLNLERTTFLAGNVGSLVGYKNQIVIANAAAHATGITWVLIGEGRERARIEAAVADNAVGERVLLAGRMTDARRCIRELDVFAFASVGEALGTSVLDAMAIGVPVVAADSAGPAEVLRPVHERTGATLYKPNDAAALAAIVERIRITPALRERMLVEQNRRIEDFRIERTAMLTLDVYREVLR